MNYVYLVRAGQGHYKIGVASNVSKRMLAIQTGNSHLVELVTARPFEKAYEVESAIHKRLRNLHADGGREWFTLTDDEALFVAIEINKIPSVDLTDKMNIAAVLSLQKTTTKSIQKQLDFIINTYQKKHKPTATIEPVLYEEKPEEVHEDVDEDDAIMDSVVKFVREKGKASTSLIQRQFRIGYGRAARIMDRMEEMKIIGPPDGSRPRIIIPAGIPSIYDIIDSKLENTNS